MSWTWWWWWFVSLLCWRIAYSATPVCLKCVRPDNRAKVSCASETLVGFSKMTPSKSAMVSLHKIRRGGTKCSYFILDRFFFCATRFSPLLGGYLLRIAEQPVKDQGATGHSQDIGHSQEAESWTLVCRRGKSNERTNKRANAHSMENT